MATTRQLSRWRVIFAQTLGFGVGPATVTGSVRLYPVAAGIEGGTTQARRDELPAEGVCTVCGEWVRFLPFTDNVRESGSCPHCGSSNRQRQMAWMLRRELAHPVVGRLRLPRGFALYNTEANGPLHGVLKLHPRYECSEYWGDRAQFGATVDGVRNEDLQALSFTDASFDIVLSSDVLEHVPDPYLAHHEIFRVLKPGGCHIFTVPYGETSPRDDVRASLVNGEIVYHAEALYHGDPVRPDQGVLVWTIFGQEMLERLEEIGFDAESWRLQEPDCGIFGPGANVFIARKPLAPADHA